MSKYYASKYFPILIIINNFTFSGKILSKTNELNLYLSIEVKYILIIFFVNSLYMLLFYYCNLPTTIFY